MKKNYFLLAAAAIMVMASCSKESVVDSEINKESNLIGFSSYKSITRGNPVDNNTEFMTPGNTFGVSAFIDTEGENGAIMGSATEGTPIICKAGSPNFWGYLNSGDMRFWPTKGQKLDFYAYSPYAHTAITNKSFTKAGGLSFNYAVPALEANQVDVMFASVKDVEKPADNIVTMPFKHALTQVHFKVATKTNSLGIDIDANGITIHNLVSKGSFALPVAGLGDGVNGWTLSTNAADVTDYIVTSTAVSGTYVGDAGTTFTTIGSADNALMLLPQTFAAAPLTDAVTNPTAYDPAITGSYLSVKCKIYQVLGDGTKVYEHGDADTFTTIYVPISSQKDISGTMTEVWNRGKKITYNMLIGGSLFDPIEFATSVEEWVDADGGVIENK